MKGHSQRMMRTFRQISTNTPRVLVWMAGSSVIFATLLAIGVLVSTQPKAAAHGRSGMAEAAPAADVNIDTADIKVKALVFFGPNRRATQHVQECYLARNLKQNGGLLTDVTFMLTTEVGGESLALLDAMISRNDGFSKRVFHQPAAGQSRFHLYYEGLEPDTYYVKLDDDVVWIDDNAVAAMLKVKLRTQWLTVSANVINHGNLAWIHGHMGAVKPFGPIDGPDKPWRLFENTTSLENTAAWKMEYSISGPSWGDGGCAAVQHYSFLDRHQEGTLDAFKSAFDTWTFDSSGYGRWSVNMIMFKGSDYNGLPPGDDEELVSHIIPRDRHQHTGAAGQALVAHYAYYPQKPYLDEHHPDILEGYAAVAAQTCKESR